MGQAKELSRNFTIRNHLGLHARPAALLVKTATQFKARITIRSDSAEVDGKSILGLMTLAADQGSTLTFVAVGEDADRALNAIEQLFEDGFGEK